MNKQFRIYSVDTKAFYTEKERELNNKRFLIKKSMNEIEEWLILTYVYKKENISLDEYRNRIENFSALKRKRRCEKLTESEEVELKDLRDYFRKKMNEAEEDKTTYKTAQEKKLEKEFRKKRSNKQNMNDIKKYLSEHEEYIELKNKLKDNNNQLNSEMTKSKVRLLNQKALSTYNQISLFENSLSRAMKISDEDVSLEMIIVRAYHYEVLKQLIENGFEYIDENGEVIKYRIFTASAGQIRTKKVIFIKEEAWNKYQKTLMCGLTIEDINKSKEQGCNINKFLAYLALCNSATDEIENFDIKKAIVIDDFETIVTGEVDYIDNKTFEVTRKSMDILIPHSDGCGWVLPSVNNKNFMIRLPWVKGLVTPVDYIKFCDEYRNSNYKITDIYGKEWDLKEDQIEYVFSKSQFKMHKYYSSWDEYVNNFIEYNCKANMCNLEPDTNEFKRANFNYQMWQTLTDITDEEIKQFTDSVDEFITKGYSDRKTMLRLLGADKNNANKSYLQKCIEIYPELIKDYHVKEELASMLNARKKEAKYGKFKINGKYTFLLPDVFAWLQFIFLGDKKPIGLLSNGEVSCRLYKYNKELLVERSPHLYREHAIRNNVVDDNTKKWFVTDGIYTSSHDLISKILQFDNDGDKSLVIADSRLIKIAKRNMEGIVPLYYEMGKAKPEIINEKNIYESLIKAFRFNNIGKFSNQLTVMWNQKEINLKTIAQITALNNFTIDAAKTLLVPEVPTDVLEDMKIAKGKMPYFFQFAKDKDPNDVAPINNSTVNRICRNIENIEQSTYDFSNIGKFNKNYLMKNPKIEIDNRVVAKYKELEKDKNEAIALYKMVIKDDSISGVNDVLKKEFVAYCDELNVILVDAIDMVIRYIYTTNRNSRKGFLFDLFGDIIYDNLKNNIKKPLGEYIMCEVCGDRVKITSKNDGSKKYCKKCAIKVLRKQKREWKLRNKEK